MIRNAALALGALALVVRVWSFWDRSPDLGPGWMPIAAGILGLVYLGSGLFALGSVPGASAALFAIHCFAQAVHWGGPPGIAGDQRLAVWLVYYVVGAIGVGALVEFVVTLPDRRRRLSTPSTSALYAPAALLLLATVVILSMADDSPARGTLLMAFFRVEALAINGLTALALVALVVRARRQPPGTPLQRALRVMVCATLLAYLPWVIGVTLQTLAPGMLSMGADPLTLLFAVEPVGFAYALSRLHAATSWPEPAEG